MSSLSPPLFPSPARRLGTVPLQPSLSLLELCKFTTEFKQVQANLTKLGLLSNSLLLTRLLCYSSISPHSDVRYARSIFNLDLNPNTFSYNVMIRGYAQSEEPDSALSLFSDMLCNGSSVPNQLTFPFVLKACSRVEAIEEGKQVHGLVFKLGLAEDLFIQNSLISLYCACGSIGFACQLFDKMREPDDVSWNSIIGGLISSGFVEEGRYMFDKMPNRNLITWNCLIDGYAKAGLSKEAREMFDQMEVRDTVSWNTMIGGYVGLGLMEDARELFDSMPCKAKDLITFNLMIDGYARDCRYKDILQIFEEMQEARTELNSFTMVSVLTACSNLTALDQGERIQEYIERNGVQVDAILGTALIDMFAKCGDLERALSVFGNLKERDVGAWNSVIHNLGIHGYGREALDMFSDMLKSNILPDEVTFLGILSACRHSGLIEEGKKYFQLMSEEYGMEPKTEHYGCLVDLLCRADCLEQARDLIESSEMKPSVRIWGALLGASSRVGDLAMGEYAAENLMKLDPFDGRCYITLSNMYSAAGLYRKAIEVRRLMRERGLEKEPGSSSIEVDGLVHEFRVSSYNIGFD